MSRLPTTSGHTSPRRRRSFRLQAERLADLRLLADGTVVMGLGHLPVGPLNSDAYDVSDDGSAVGISRAGETYTPGIWTTNVGDRAFRWTMETGMQDLGTLPGSDRSKARACPATALSSSDTAPP